jgi:hypothetical protein
MLKRTARNLVITGMTIMSATLLTVLGAAGASATTTVATQHSHAGVTAKAVVQAGPAAHIDALAHVPATLASPAQSAYCAGYSLKDDGQTQGGGGYYLTDEGHNQPVETTGTGSCWDFFGVSSSCPNGGCFVIQDLTEGFCLNVADGYVYADSCQSTDHNEWWWAAPEANGSETFQNFAYGKNLTALHVYPGGNGSEVVVAGGPPSAANRWWQTPQ